MVSKSFEDDTTPQVLHDFLMDDNIVNAVYGVDVVKNPVVMDTEDQGTIITSGPTVAVDCQPSLFNDFEFPANLSIDDILKDYAEPVIVQPPVTQEEVRYQFYLQHVAKQCGNMFGWGNNAAELAVQAQFDKVMKQIFLNPRFYVTEMQDFEYRLLKLNVPDPLTMSHNIYSGCKHEEPDCIESVAITHASHYCTAKTERCRDGQWHTHELELIPAKITNGELTAKRDYRSYRSRIFRNFLNQFGRYGCGQCIALSQHSN